MKMIIEFKDLRPNPFRDFTVDPIDGPENDNAEIGYVSAVTKLRESVERHGFWGGIVLRPSPTEFGKYEIAAGHHRIEAAKLAGETAAELVVRPLTDVEMIQVYGTENATQRGASSSALAGTVAAALRKVAQDRAVAGEFTSNPKGGRKLGDQDIGRPAIKAVIGDVPGMSDERIKSQLAIIKDSGDYRRIIGEVAEEARLAREAAEKRAEEARIAQEEAEEAERIAEEERKEAARKAKEAKAERERKQAEKESAEAAVREQQAKEKAEADRRLAEEAKKRADEAASAEENVQKLKDKADNPKLDRNFDYQGVSKWLHNDYQIRSFQKWCKSEGIRPYLNVESQHLVAKALAVHAAENNIELSGSFIHTKATEMLLSAKTSSQKKINQEERRRLLEQSFIDKANRYMHDFARGCGTMVSAGNNLIGLDQNWPKGLPFPITGEFREKLRAAKIVIDRLHKEISIDV